MTVLGLDIGTTACKAVLVNDHGEIIAGAEREHEVAANYPGWAEADPEQWWRGAVETSQAVLGKAKNPGIAALGVAGMVPALILVDAEGAPVRPSIQQNDARATDEIRWLREHYPEDELFRRTGATWNQQVVPPKILWLKRHEPQRWARAVRVTGSYEYVTWRMTGVPYVEANWALESGLWDPRKGEWIEELFHLLEIDPAMFAPVRLCHEVVGSVAARAGRILGVEPGIPVIAGSADHIAAALAAGLTDPGEAVFKLGGAGDFLYVVDEFVPHRQLFIDFHDVPGKFVLNGCMATSGSVVKWFRERFRPTATYGALDEEAALIRPGSDGLLVLPYFLGEKTPIHDPFARGTVVGLTLSHTPAHVYRAILEGIAYGFRHHLEIIAGAGYPVTRCYVMDGGARSALWRGIIASVLGREVYYLNQSRAGSAYGVAFVCGVAAGLWDWTDARSRVRVIERVEPDPHAASVYAEGYEAYLDTYRRLAGLFPALRWDRADGA
jgi:xylulokinase